MTDYVLVLTTWPEGSDFEAFAQTLVAEKLAACVNVLPPMTSIYRWKGAVESATERQILIKTTAASMPALSARVNDLHPYDVPELIAIPIEQGGEAYLAWIGESVG